jgi:hypothetical protein
MLPVLVQEKLHVAIQDALKNFLRGVGVEGRSACAELHTTQVAKQVHFEFRFICKRQGMHPHPCPRQIHVAIQDALRLSWGVFLC